MPLGFDPRTQFRVFAVFFRNITVPVEFAMVGKLTQTIFLGGAANGPFKTEAF
jgi:hypothetical protein